MKTYKIAAVDAVCYPVLSVTFDDGFGGEIDLSGDIRPGSLFEPLSDRHLFGSVAVAPNGRSLGWNLGEVGREIDLGADSLRIDIETNHVRQMAKRFREQRPAAE